MKLKEDDTGIVIGIKLPTKSIEEQLVSLIFPNTRVFSNS